MPTTRLCTGDDVPVFKILSVLSEIVIYQDPVTIVALKRSNWAMYFAIRSFPESLSPYDSLPCLVATFKRRSVRPGQHDTAVSLFAQPGVYDLIPTLERHAVLGGVAGNFVPMQESTVSLHVLHKESPEKDFSLVKERVYIDPTQISTTFLRPGAPASSTPAWAPR